MKSRDCDALPSLFACGLTRGGTGYLLDQLSDAIFELERRFSGKAQSQNALRLAPALSDGVSDPVGHGTGLSTTGSGKNEERTVP